MGKEDGLLGDGGWVDVISELLFEYCVLFLWFRKVQLKTRYSNLVGMVKGNFNAACRQYGRSRKF